MAQVKLILRDSVPNLGEAGDLVSVKPGFARNYLVPQGKATLATESNVKELEHQKRVVSEKLTKELKDIRGAAKALGKVVLEVAAQAGEGGRLFGSVTTAQISDLLSERGYDFNKRKISLESPIKEVGDHTASIKLHRDLSVDVTVKVTAAAEPAAAPPDADDDLVEDDDDRPGAFDDRDDADQDED